MIKDSSLIVTFFSFVGVVQLFVAVINKYIHYLDIPSNDNG